MAVWYSLWSLGIFFAFWYVLTKKNLATLHCIPHHQKPIKLRTKELVTVKIVWLTFEAQKFRDPTKASFQDRLS
jgi:hypothetical protein